MTEQSGGHSSLSERSLRSPSPAETATTPFEANMVDVEGGPALQLVHPATLADALELARLNGSLPIDKLVQIASAIRVVEKATGLAADKLPSAPGTSRPSSSTHSLPDTGSGRSVGRMPSPWSANYCARAICSLRG